jgi:hypothetical protein
MQLLVATTPSRLTNHLQMIMRIEKRPCLPIKKIISKLQFFYHDRICIRIRIDDDSGYSGGIVGEESVIFVRKGEREG